MDALSCGILLITPDQSLLLGHATGTAHWDIPKGLQEPGETPTQTALRETAEETGLQLRDADLLALGRFAYRPGKQLHLFACAAERLALSSLHCHSRFIDRYGRERPEIDRFAWVPFHEVPTRCARRMAQLLQGPISLEQVWASLGYAAC